MSTSAIIAISQVIQAWGLFRDQGRWRELEALFHEGASISVSWYAGDVPGFVARCRETFKASAPRGKHLIGSPFVTVSGARAVAETSIQILGRFEMGGVAVDNTTYARFIDRLSDRGAGWRIESRRAVYEKDRFDPVTPSPAYERLMAEADVASIPEPYRFIGYRLKSLGRSLRDDILCDGSAEAEAYLAEAHAWLDGA